MILAAATNWFDWILAKLPVLIFLLVFVAQAIRGLLRAKQDHPAPTAKPSELEEQRRTQEVQEQIRRRIAERRGSAAPPPPLPREHAPQPIERRTETTQMPEPMGGPLRRVFEEIQREMNPEPSRMPPPVPTPPAGERHGAELERQRRLADQLKSVEDTRAVVQRRAVHVAAEKKAVSQEEPALRTAARELLLADLGRGENLRRAFVLREVLGPPVALR